MRKIALPLSHLFAALLVASCSSAPADPTESQEFDEPVPPSNNIPVGPEEESAPVEAAAPAIRPQDGSQASEWLQDERERLSLEDQKKVFLVERHLANAESLLDRLRLEEAEAEIVRALELDPDNIDAKQKLSEVSALLGRPGAGVESISQELVDRYEVRLQQLRADAQDGLNRARTMIARGDYDAAVNELTIAQSHVRWAPTTVDWAGLDGEIDSTLQAAKEGRMAASEASQVDQQRKAFEALQEEATVARERRQAVTATMIEQAIGAFNAGKYDKAMDYADKALRNEPRNEQAQEVRDAAFRAGREQVRSDYVAAKREQFQRWKEDLAEMRVAWTDVITLPDEDFWADITESRGKRRGLEAAIAESPAETELRQMLTTTRIPGLEVDELESLSEVIGIIRTYTELPLVVDPAAESAALDEAVVYDYSLRNPLTVEQALNIITSDSGEEVTWTVRHEAVIVTTREKARGEPVIYNHDVQDLVFGLTDFLGPRIDRLRLLDELEDDDGGGPFGGIGEKPQLIDMDSLATLIQENVAVGTWEDEGVSIDVGEGYILVVHTPQIQQRVADFLDDLRRFASSLVTIESKFMTVADNFLQEIGIDFRGLDNPGTPFTDLDDVTNGLEDMASRGLDNNGTGTLGSNAAGSPSSGFFFDDGLDGDYKGRIENFFLNPLGSAVSNIGGMTLQWTFLNDLNFSAILRAVEKTQQVSLINDQVLSVHNTQRANVSIINQQAYIQDFDVEVAQFQAIADPQINVLTEGVVLDVRPTIHHNRKYLTLEIQPTVARVVALRNFSTTLAGNTSPVEFQLPELEVQSVFTTAVIPDGGSILIGGLTNIRNIERRAEVPFLSSIPILGFLTKSEGFSNENESLMILIRAQITDVKDELARYETR